VASKDFWEVIDRGTNFDYLDAGRREQLRVYFSWFPAFNTIPPTGAPTSSAIAG